MAKNIVMVNDFDSNKIVFLPPRPNKMGGQSVLINYAEDGGRGGPFMLQTCRVRAPFGIDLNDKGPDGPKYHFSVSLANEQTENQNLKKFTQNCRDLDSLAKQEPETNSSWFGKCLSSEIISEFYKSAEKFPKDSKWPSNLKIKLPFDRQGKPQFVIYDENKNPVDVLDSDGNVKPDAIPKGSELVCLIQPTGVWFVGKTQYGVGYKLLQAKLYKNSKLTGYAIVDDEDDTKEEEEEEEEEEDGEEENDTNAE